MPQPLTAAALEKTANLHFPNPFRRNVAVEANHGFTLRVGPVNPESRGEITLRSADPSQAPKIQANYLETEFDRRTMVAGIRMTREVGNPNPDCNPSGMPVLESCALISPSHEIKYPGQCPALA